MDDLLVDERRPPLSPTIGGAVPVGAVCWSAVVAGAVVSVALATVLTALAAGFGMSLAYPGAASRASLQAFTPVLGAWMIAIQVVSAALGGYLAGRLRGHWPIHDDEAHFRDTAHGLLVWAVGTVAGVALAVTVISPYAEHLAGPVAPALSTGLSPAETALSAARDADIAAQSAFFMGVGLLLSAFIACVAAAVGGLRSHEMHLKA